MTLPLMEIYRDFHSHPELAFAETRTAGRIAEILEGLGVRTETGIGGTGVVGVLENGDGPVILLRADMDALPIREDTGLEYASTYTARDRHGNEHPAMHACGHDVHVTTLLGAVDELVARRSEWRGTVLALFQPAEEDGGGAQAMIDDGLYERVPLPEVVLGQHVTTTPAGYVGLRAGIMMGSTDMIDVVLHGRGGHGSRPEETVDPVVMAAAVILRLQGIVAREVSPFDRVVITVGQVEAGSAPNIIPASATLRISVRTFDADVRVRVLDAIERIVRGEAAASGAPREPEITRGTHFPQTFNDIPASERTRRALVSAFGDDKVLEPPIAAASDDVGILASAIDVPLVFWLIGIADPELFDPEHPERIPAEVPPHHSPKFAPVAQPSLETGVRAFVDVSLEWLDTAG
jgi:amidohydrolase